jgi:hypothetical protein
MSTKNNKIATPIPIPMASIKEKVVGDGVVLADGVI